MKKYIITLSVVFILSFVINKEDNTISVFNEDNNEYGMYVLEFNNNLSTNNIESILKDLKIIWIEPYINSLYKNKISYRYYFEDISLKQNIIKFKRSFITKLNNSNYKLDAINYEISGVRIHKVKLYCKEEDILNLKIKVINYKKDE